MTLIDIQNDLDRLNQLQQDVMDLRQRKALAIAKAIPDDVKVLLTQIDQTFDDHITSADESIRLLRDAIGGAVLELGQSVKASALHAVYASGRVSWDTKALDGYAAAHPEVSQFRKQGEPVVSIRPIRGK